MAAVTNFHLIDPDWGHLTFKMSGHPPFGLLIMLNVRECVERQARFRYGSWSDGTFPQPGLP
jgi:hypothetical protein